jgi:hypothetical protein
MALWNGVNLDRFELLELRRDDGIQTYHAREIATKRPVQVHVFPDGHSPESLALLSKVAYLPEAERRRVIDRGMFQGRPYVVTDRLAGYASLREWLDRSNASTSTRSVDEQFAQLFDKTPVLEKTPAPVTPIRMRPRDEPEEPEDSPMQPLVLGVAAAILFLVLLLAFTLFHRR